MRIYFDGIVEKSKSGTTSSLVNVKDSAFKIGAKNTASSDFDGEMDDFRIYDQALSDIEISGLFRGADIALAWGARPFNGQSDVILDPVLSWRNGQFAASHNVYFGTDFDDVNDADTTTAGVYKGNQEANEYDPGTLDFDTTYYWRIDEVNNADVNSPWKGRTWEFTVANYIVIDDMESYDPFINRIWYAWDNPWGTGSFVELGVTPFVPVHGGDNSLEFLYDNTLKWDFFSYWSESEYSLDSAQDWTHDGVQVLTVLFHGDPNEDANATEQMYVGIEDSGAGRMDIYYPDMNDIVVEEWHEWNIEISDFAGVDATAITKVYLGFGSSDNTDTPGGEGLVYFDDIRLYPPKCVPSLGPALDFSGDCIVGFDEMAMMSEDWLLSDLLLVGIGAPDPCVLHYKFDESSGTTVADSSGNGYTGEAFGDLNQTPVDISIRMDAGISGNSFHFSHGGGVEECGINIPLQVFTDNSISQEITVALWIKNAHTEEDPDGGAFMLEFREWDEVSPDANDRVLAVETTDDGETYVFHDNSQDVSYDLDWDSHTEWTHYCFVRDANNLAIYVNGILEEVSSSSGAPLADPNLLYLGLSADRAPGNSEGMHDGFTGNVEDFQIFDYALTESQAGYLGTAGTGYVPMPPSIMDLYDGEPAGLKAVNLRDFAVLMNSWLEIQLWPE